MRGWLLLTLFCFGFTAQAQREGANSAWFQFAYTYSDILYKESQMKESGRFAGIRGELGIGLIDNMGVSVGGSYMDGHLLYDGETLSGTSVKQYTNDYFRDLRGLVHFFYGPMALATGIGQRYWYDDLVTSYRRRTQYDYFPVILTVYREYSYFKFEADVWRHGKNISQMSDVSPAEHDVEFSQSSGMGYGLEVGVDIPTAAKIMTRIYISYHRWEVQDSDTQNDGVYNLVEPKSSTQTVQAGIGIDF